MKKIVNKIKTIIVILFILCLIGILIIACCMNYAKAKAEPYLYYDRGIGIIPDADYIIVPGAQIFAATPSLYLAHRLDYAYDLYVASKASKIIISGGFDQEIGKYECEIMKKYLIELGVNKEDIISDLNGYGTYETLKRVKEYVGDKKVIFCTQEVYSYRAMYIANNLDLDMIVMCSDKAIYTETGKNMNREYLALIKAILNCTIMPIDVPSIEERPFI